MDAEHELPKCPRLLREARKALAHSKDITLLAVKTFNFPVPLETCPAN